MDMVLVFIIGIVTILGLIFPAAQTTCIVALIGMIALILMQIEVHLRDR
jgi:hypothetical protein